MMPKKNPIMPRNMWVPIILTLACNTLAYYGTRLLTADRPHHNLSNAFDVQTGCQKSVSLYERRFFCKTGVPFMFPSVSNDEHEAVDCRGFPVGRAYAAALSGRCGRQSLPVDSLSDKLFLLYRSERERKNSPMVPGGIVLDCRQYLSIDADDKTACMV